jgi:4-hydroxybenzoate polyprenyltransferase
MTRIIKISRPRFWLYVFGPYIVGLAAGSVSPDDFVRIGSLIFGLYFLLPANLLIYGVNDIFDFGTDAINPKKAGYEMLVRPETHRSLWIWIAVLNLPFIAWAIFHAPRVLTSLAAFLFLSVFYSAPPIRAKEIPYLDSLFNILYVFPAALAYQLVTGEFPPLSVILAAGLWTAAMHAYSAIPDIDADRTVGIDTVATRLGPAGTHIFCIGCYIGAAALCATFAPPLVLLNLVYVAVVLTSMYSSKVSRFYRAFPIINSVSGFVLFWYVAWPKFF